MYTGGTTLLDRGLRAGRKGRTQGANDFVIFTTMGLSSFASGALVSSAGWEKMNLGAIPVLAVALGAVLWLAMSRRAARVASA